MSTSFPNLSVPQTENKSPQFSSILDSLPAYVFYIDNNFCFQYINKAFELWMGISKESIAGQPLVEVLDGNNYLRLKELAEKALSGININFETELPFRNGMMQFIEGSFTPEFEETGIVRGFVGFLKEVNKKGNGRGTNLAENIIEQLDESEIKEHINPQPFFAECSPAVPYLNKMAGITELRQAELPLPESGESFSKIVDGAPVMLWMSGRDKRYNFFNKGWLDFTGRTFEEEMDNGWAKNIHSGDYEYCLNNYLTAFDKREEFVMEYRFKRHDGVYRWLQDIGKPHFSPDGSFAGYLGSCIDVTERKLTTDALEKEVKAKTKELQLAYQQMVRYNVELEQFAYAASHDLQEPLRKIQTFANMLSERNYNELNEAGKNYVSRIIKSSERMSDIINDLLYYSRQSRIDGIFEETDLNLVIENVLSELELLIQQKGAIIECNELPCIKSIPSQMNRIFYNLINNSLKFSNPEVPPRIKISAKDWEMNNHENTPPFIQLLVEDNGIGFEQKYSERIFQLFQRLNDKYSYGGNGIGLALCKKIIQNHNGLISAESEPNKGATFHIKLPNNILVEEKAEVV